jgi:hypothetical protein
MKIFKILRKINGIIELIWNNPELRAMWIGLIVLYTFIFVFWIVLHRIHLR